MADIPKTQASVVLLASTLPVSDSNGKQCQKRAALADIVRVAGGVVTELKRM